MQNLVDIRQWQRGGRKLQILVNFGRVSYFTGTEATDYGVRRYLVYSVTLLCLYNVMFLRLFRFIVCSIAMA